MNSIIVSGTIVNDPVTSHRSIGETFYGCDIMTARKSGNFDILPCIVPEVFTEGLKRGTKVQFIGEIRTRNEVSENGKKRLKVAIFVKNRLNYEGYDEQTVEIIDGYLCKAPTCRKTPLGREIADILIASNRPYGKTAYIPCIAWGRNAIRVANMNVGDKITAKGRLQSRVYTKRYENGTEEQKVAYELSLNYINTEENANGNED